MIMIKYFLEKIRYFLGVIAAIAIVAIATFNMGLNSQNEFSAVYRANVEALSGETNTDKDGKRWCVSKDDVSGNESSLKSFQICPSEGQHMCPNYDKRGYLKSDVSPSSCYYK
jgi:hypothetical protein